MFLGQTINLLDEKSRIVLPSRYRNEMGTDFFVVLDFDRCLSLYPTSLYEKRASRIQELDDFNSNARQVKRLFFANSFALSMDKQGRISLPKVLLDKAGINKEVVIVGMNDHLEVWDQVVFNQKEEAGEESYSDLASALIGGK